MLSKLNVFYKPHFFFHLPPTRHRMMYAHSFALLNSGTCGVWLLFTFWNVSSKIPWWLPFYMKYSYVSWVPPLSCPAASKTFIYPTGSLEAWVPNSSVQMLTANYLDSCFLSTLTLPHKRDLKSWWPAALWNPDFRGGRQPACFNRESQN